MPDPIFLVGRFRSGTSLIWSWFDRDPNCVALYEPLHDNLLQHIDATRPTDSHRGINDYWSDYRSRLSDIERFHRPHFGTERLLLEARDEHDELRDYLGCLMRSANDRRVVFKFNRADFRLPWLRQLFPEALIVYLRRNNRDVWLSSRRHLPESEVDNPNYPDAFDLLQWSASLAEEFPFLWLPGIDSFTRHEFLWQLADCAGMRLADETLNYEDIVANPDKEISPLCARGWLSEKAAADAAASVDQSQRARWEGYRPAAWFEERETRVSELLDELGLATHFGDRPLSEIREAKADAWRTLPELSYKRVVAPLLVYGSERRGKVTELLAELRRS